MQSEGIAKQNKRPDRSQKNPEDFFGGERGIRTPDTNFVRIPDFESGTFGHSDISPSMKGSFVEQISSTINDNCVVYRLWIQLFS